MKKTNITNDASNSKCTIILGTLVLFLLTLAAYSPALMAGFIWDDDDYVTENRTLRSVAGLRAMWMEKGAIPQYYPLTHTTFWLEYQIWGLWAPGYHATNIFLHALGAFLLWRLLIRLRIAGAWWIALFFALHPVHVESVAWITERKNVLSGVFYLAAFLLYWRTYEQMQGRIRVISLHYAGVVLLFLAALFSKTVTCSFPAALLLVIWWKKGRIDRNDLIPLLPLFGIGLIMAWITVHFERTVVMAVGHEWDLSFIDRGLIAGRALWFYIGKLLWPVQLTFFYPRWSIDAFHVQSYLYPLGIALLLLVLWLFQKQVGRGPIVAVLFFAGTLTPALGFFDVYPMRYSFVADHFQYLASIGILVGLIGAIAYQIERRSIPRFPGIVVGSVLAITLGVMTWNQSHMYKDLETLWRTTIERNPTAWAAHNNLGLLLHRRGQPDAAFEHYQAAYAIRANAPEVLVNIGYWHAERGATDEALHWYERAISARTDYPDAYYNMGNVHLHAGRYDEAIRLYLIALSMRATDPRIVSNLAQAYFHKGALGHAERYYLEALALDPDAADDHMNLGIVRATLGRHPEAIESFKRALFLQPRHQRATFRLISSYLAQGNYAAALGAAERFIEQDPDNVDMYVTLGDLYAMRGAEQTGIDQYRKALDLDPDHLLALNNMAWLLATSPNDAIRDGGAALLAAQRANQLTAFRQPGLLNTLAAAHAELGAFDEALRLMRNLMDHTEDEQQQATYRERLQRYETGQPYRRSMPSS